MARAVVLCEKYPEQKAKGQQYPLELHIPSPLKQHVVRQKPLAKTMAQPRYYLLARSDTATARETVHVEQAAVRSRGREETDVARKMKKGEDIFIFLYFCQELRHISRVILFLSF